MDHVSEQLGTLGEGGSSGCLNLITPEKRKQAAGLIHNGTTVSCARPITTEITPDVTYQVQRYMVDSGEGRETDPPERRRVRRGAAEFIGMVFHGQTITHIDALSHYSWQGKMEHAQKGGGERWLGRSPDKSQKASCFTTFDTGQATDFRLRSRPWTLPCTRLISRP